MNKRTLVGAIAALLALSATHGGIAYMAHDLGETKGLDNYHNQCYNFGPGLVINEETGTAVMCGPLTTVPQEERKNFQSGT
jgi:hypothetical protein